MDIILREGGSKDEPIKIVFVWKNPPEEVHHCGIIKFGGDYYRFTSVESNRAVYDKTICYSIE